jgi:hypothetical protein
LLEWLASRTQTTINFGKVVGKKKPSCTPGRNVKLYNHYGKKYEDLAKTVNRTAIRSSNSIPRDISEGM